MPQSEATRNGACPQPAIPPRPRLQQDWLAQARGHRLRVRFVDGTTVAGALVASDQYCLALALPDQSEPILIFKHAVAALAFLEPSEQKNPAR